MSTILGWLRVPSVVISVYATLVLPPGEEATPVMGRLLALASNAWKRTWPLAEEGKEETRRGHQFDDCFESLFFKLFPVKKIHLFICLFPSLRGLEPWEKLSQCSLHCGQEEVLKGVEECSLVREDDSVYLSCP